MNEKIKCICCGKEMQIENFYINGDLKYVCNNCFYKNDPNQKFFKKIKQEKRYLTKEGKKLKLKNACRSSIVKAIKFKDKDIFIEKIGCTSKEFKLHIESLFEPWMTWENHGEYTGNENETWHIDHIKSLSLADTESKLLELNNYLNLRPLCSLKNLKRKRN